MKYTYLPNTKIKVSKICLGTMTYGNQNNVKESEEQMDYALENGVNFFDCILPLVIILVGKIKLGTPASNKEP